MAADDASLVSLDRLSRLVHAINYFAADGDRKLVLNVHNRLLAAVADDHGAAFRRALQSLGLPLDRFVIQMRWSASSYRTGPAPAHARLATAGDRSAGGAAALPGSG